MKFVTYEDQSACPRLGALYKNDTRIADLASAYKIMNGKTTPHFESLQTLIEGEDDALRIASRTLDFVINNETEGTWIDCVEIKFLAPLPCPVQMRDFLCFKDHLLNSQATARLLTGQAQEDGNQTDPMSMMLKTMNDIPIYYKCNRFSVIGPDVDIVWPDYSSLLDYEMEFAAIIGKKTKDVTKDEAGDYIFGYTMFNDMSARDYQMKEMRGMLGPCKGKDFDFGTVIGPCIVTADEIDPDNADMIVRINGQEVSRGNSRDMYHKFEDCIEYVSRCETLYPGELIASGTVGMGSGFERLSFLELGDVIELEVPGIGILKNSIVAGPVRKNPDPIKTDPVLKDKWSDVAHETWTYEKGLHSISKGIYAWLSPDGSWGLSNAGLITDSGRSLLVDTLYDLNLTREMLESMRKAEPEAMSFIDTVINTHGDGDHWFGNELVKDAEIIASSAAFEQMQEMLPFKTAALVSIYSKAPTALGRFIDESFSRFRFDDINPVFPTKQINDKMTVSVGSKKVELIVVGPAHTQGDTLVYVPEDRVLFSGDIVFAGCTPVVHAGPVRRYIDALKLILSMDVDVIVPGHGPITNKRGVEVMIAYLEYIYEEAKKRFDAGMNVVKAARDIDLKEFRGLGNADRLVFNVMAAYKEFSGSSDEVLITEKMAMLSEIGDY